MHSAQLRFLVSHRDLFDSRVLDGRIVDGHGDLRPDHIYLYQLPIVIDCIEFHADYRTNDVIDELAFLAMCCDRLDEPSVGKSLFDAYERQSGESCDPQLVEFYKAYRACVRAKVAGLRCGQQSNRDASDSLHAEHAYLDLASRYVERLDPPFVLIVGGLMGTGKSTLARELQQSLSAELISSDAVRDAHINSNGQPPPTVNPQAYGIGKYSPAARIENYQRMIDKARGLISQNRAVIFDATFTLQLARQLVAGFAAANGYRVLQVECECTRNEAIARITERVQCGGSLSEALPDHYDQQVAQAEPPLAVVPLVRVDTTLALAEEQTVVLDALIPILTDINS